MKRLIYQSGANILVFRLGKTSNAKISEGNEQIVQTYTYSIMQYLFARGNKLSYDFFNHDDSCCLSCPFKSKEGKCYTHKFGQLRGFYSMLRSLPELDQIPELPNELPAELLTMCKDRYVRFGTYGEPIFIPEQWIKGICDVAKSWTGYTHAWVSNLWSRDYFMASVESAETYEKATILGFRVFYVAQSTKKLVNCPASKEGNRKANCSDCGLCSGNMGKGRKSVYIIQH